jgi:lysophospholipid acyltransferase (LPLAT)-like uncharacterized protein
MRVRLSHPVMLRLTAMGLAWYAKLVIATSRVHHQTPPPAVMKRGPVLLALWHQQIFAVTMLARPNAPHPLVGLMSASHDGQLTKAVASHFGIGAAVGSSSKLAVPAARALIRLARSGHSIFLTPDGPRGPAWQAKPGASEIARLTGLPLVPCAVKFGWVVTCPSWDSFWVPLPFGRVELCWGAPLAAKSSAADLTRELARLNQGLPTRALPS